MTTLRARNLAGMGRSERKLPWTAPLHELHGKRILVTGAAGSIGAPLVKAMRKAGLNVTPTDINTVDGPWGTTYLDITNFGSVLQTVAIKEPDLIINLAAAKLAPQGELYPWTTLNTSVNGAKNLLDMGRRVLQVSTCKAGDPEVTYGGGKFVAEKLVLAHGGTIVRLYNVPEAGPSMLTIWDDTPEDQPIEVVADCWRYCLTLNEALASIIWAAALPSGRYAADPGESVNIAEYAARAYPKREVKLVRPRRGDRLREPLHAKCESVVPAVRHLNKIISIHDPAVRSDAKESR